MEAEDTTRIAEVLDNLIQSRSQRRAVAPVEFDDTIVEALRKAADHSGGAYSGFLNATTRR